jgi:peptidoglycan hydrolase-like protein with peptidoglycan-binding domain
MSTNPNPKPYHFYDYSFTPHPDLHPWDVGPAVAEMQDLLRAHGYPIRADGDFGWKTEQALKTFQRRSGLRVDSIVGQQTWTALKMTVQPGTRLLKQGLSGADVGELQGLLCVNGYSVKRTGNFDEKTREAVVGFQHRHHLQADGIVSSVMWTLLRGTKFYT